MDRTARFSSLIEKVADAPAPSRELFAEVRFATTGKQYPDIKGRFAVLMDAKAWTEAALITVACALPDWRVVTKASRGAGEALMLPPDYVGGVPERSSDTARHAEGPRCDLPGSAWKQRQWVGDHVAVLPICGGPF